MNHKPQAVFGWKLLLSFALSFVCCGAAFAQFESIAPAPRVPQKQSTPGGELWIFDKDGKKQIACPLAHTDVQAELAGLSGRVRVKQIFRNPLAQKIEAVYVFPLPSSAAVDDMTMIIGERKIKGQIKPREEARAIYEAAKAQGKTASLLDQERPNIFTQSIANIAPNAEIVIEISYVETVKFEDGVYEWVFPTVVGPRYIPGGNQVPDAGKISPPVAGRITQTAPKKISFELRDVSIRDLYVSIAMQLDISIGFSADFDAELKIPYIRLSDLSAEEVVSEVADSAGLKWVKIKENEFYVGKIIPKNLLRPILSTPIPTQRAGHDISIAVRLNTGDGSELKEIGSTLHRVKIERDKMGATVSLENKKEIPNKDFVLRYNLGNGEIGNSFVTQTDDKGRFFSLVLQPPTRVTRQQTVPRELIFVLDTSGSMSGFPIEKSKAVMKRALDAMGENDEFNLITFAGETQVLWESPRANNPQNRAEAQKFLDAQDGGGGTEMMKAINTALEGQDSQRLRVVCFLTDGFVGNDMAIIDSIQKNAKTARVFSFGIGNSVNRFLLDGMAQAGRGAAEFVTLASDAENAADRFFQRINAPVLTDISIDWGNLPVEEIYPKAIPDLFSENPIVIRGRLKGATEKAGIITLRGRNASGAFERRVRVTPSNAINVPTQNASLSTLWAREKIAYLMLQNMAGLQSGNFPKELKDEITSLGMEFCLMTQFTSFVAVEEKNVVVEGESITIAVPVEMPEGVSYESVFGEESAQQFGLGVTNQFANGRGFGGATGTLGPAGIIAGNGYLVGGNDSDSFDSIPISPVAKLSTPLRDLAAKVEQNRKNGDYNASGLKVKNYQIRLKIYLSEWNDATREELKKLGFSVSWESSDVRFVIGNLDVRKLEELTKVESVVRVETVGK